MFLSVSYAEISGHFLDSQTRLAQAHATLDWAGLVDWIGRLVHRPSRGCKSRLLRQFADQCLFILAALVVLSAGGCLAFIAVSVGTAKDTLANRHPRGCLCYRHRGGANGLSDFHAVAGTTGRKQPANRSFAGSPTKSGFTRNASGTGYRDLPGDDERVHGFCAFPKVTGARTPRR